MRKPLIILLSIFLLFYEGVYSQEITDTIRRVKVTTTDGEEYKGSIILNNEEKLILKTNNGEVMIVSKNVKTIEQINEKNKFEYPNPHDTRYFFSPSGIPIKKKTGYYQNIYVTTNFVNYGISKNFSIGGGFEFISTVSGSPIWFLSPKFGFEIDEKIHVATGFIMAGMSSQGAVSIAYGVGTYGTSNTNASIGLGYGFADGELTKYPALMLSGTHRFSTGFSILTENYIVPNSSDANLYIGVHGVRILSQKNAFDIGALVISTMSDIIPALPFVGYARAF